jgi:protein-disulfide isomerase
LRFVTARQAMLPIILLLLAAVGCKAQDAKDAAAIKDPVLARQIEVQVRSEFNVPADYVVTVGGRKPSDLPGFDKLQVTFSKGERNTTTDFLISTDNKTLARLERFDLNNIPAQKIPVAGRPIRGNPAAKVTVINFDDLECPYCARMHQQLFPQTLDHYKDLVRFVYKDDPLVDMHPWAMHAAVDANCIADQNQSAYWGYVDYLHAHGQDVSGSDRDVKKSDAMLDKIAREQGKIFALDPVKLDACLEKQDETAVRESMKQAEALGVEGTPFTFIDGERINGAQPVEQVWTVIDRALRAAGVEPPPRMTVSPSQAPPPLGK